MTTVIKFRKRVLNLGRVPQNSTWFYQPLQERYFWNEQLEEAFYFIKRHKVGKTEFAWAIGSKDSWLIHSHRKPSGGSASAPRRSSQSCWTWRVFVSGSPLAVATQVLRAPQHTPATRWTKHNDVEPRLLQQPSPSLPSSPLCTFLPSHRYNTPFPMDNLLLHRPKGNRTRSEKDERGTQWWRNGIYQRSNRLPATRYIQAPTSLMRSFQQFLRWCLLVFHPDFR